MNELNQKIHEWLGKCWHEPKIEEPKCKHCGLDFTTVEIDFWTKEYNLRYDTDPAAMLELLESLRQKGWSFTVKVWISSFYGVTLQYGSQVHFAEDDTLPMAVALAVGKLIDNE